MKKLLISAIASTVLLTAGVSAQEAQSEKQAKSAAQFRQALLQLVRSNVGALGAMAKGAIPMDADTIETNATRLEQLSLMMDDYFALDTTKFDIETAALPKIWQNRADFATKVDALTDASQTLKTAAMNGDESAYKGAIGNVLKSCKGCHDSYKAE
ncbi:MAG: cytochrome C [Alteromonadaceae bacterium]|jgi:cytochrome c556|uniref:Cytochrome c n=2 Tax=Paraglaciecola chathamensis TaxID=368405 RepID=A0A8H9IA08_9ALTE|nr:MULTISPECIES: cytochrome c [Paraglaciecola]AEE23210.1 cytochrome c class II [Glaciecola sp. 4H-3-7+YE-5]MBN26189.1 cytochrome C [Alteromonadaceae bacterium]GAC07558.1 cytochrome c' [Paraglaciecola agarilytica NO2]GGZ61633.1 cytochrome c [Paraglaciecola oceanifecundans]|tara:strand:- start:389 stop:856 length:468 start_codon:yes stop_codon:yes gene_type:complete